jgi:hypothetical protein
MVMIVGPCNGICHLVFILDIANAIAVEIPRRYETRRGEADGGFFAEIVIYAQLQRIVADM